MENMLGSASGSEFETPDVWECQSYIKWSLEKSKSYFAKKHGGGIIKLCGCLAASGIGSNKYAPIFTYPVAAVWCGGLHSPLSQMTWVWYPSLSLYFHIVLRLLSMKIVRRHTYIHTHHLFCVLCFYSLSVDIWTYWLMRLFWLKFAHSSFECVEFHQVLWATVQNPALHVTWWL